MVEQDGVKVMIITSDTEQHRVGVAVLYEKKLHLFHLFAVIDPYDDMMLNSQTTFFFFPVEPSNNRPAIFSLLIWECEQQRSPKLRKKLNLEHSFVLCTCIILHSEAPTSKEKIIINYFLNGTFIPIICPQSAITQLRALELFLL